MHVSRHKKSKLTPFEHSPHECLRLEWLITCRYAARESNATLSSCKSRGVTLPLLKVIPLIALTLTVEKRVCHVKIIGYTKTCIYSRRMGQWNIGVWDLYIQPGVDLLILIDKCFAICMQIYEVLMQNFQLFVVDKLMKFAFVEVYMKRNNYWN